VDRANESPEELFQRTLQMDARIARLLTAAEIVTLEELAYVPMQELLDVPGLAESEAQLFRKRAHAYLLKQVMRGHDDGDGVDA
jgi:transcription termination factor NusA